MRRYLLVRLGQNVLTFFLFLTIVFILVDAQPGDYGNQFLNDPRLTPEQRQTIRAQMGLDEPVLKRYVTWISNAVQGDFGISYSNYPRRVLDVIAERAPRTIVLFLSAIILSYYLGFATGKMLAWRRGGWGEYGATVGGVALYTVFLPWFALMMIWFWAYKTKLFPIGKFLDPVLWRDAPLEANYVFNRILLSVTIASVLLVAWLFISRKLNPGKRTLVQWSGTVTILLVLGFFWYSTGVARFALDILQHLVLPIVTLATVNFAGTMLLTRNSMLETMREDYIMAARAKGLSAKDIRDKHAARNAMLPVVTAFVLAVAFILDGGVITETIFAYPGLGSFMARAAAALDVVSVLGMTLFSSFVLVFGNLIVDVLYGVVDPRIRLQ